MGRGAVSREKGGRARGFSVQVSVPNLTSPKQPSHETKSPVASVCLFLRNVYCNLLRGTRRTASVTAPRLCLGSSPFCLGVTAKTPRPTKIPSI